MIESRPWSHPMIRFRFRVRVRARARMSLVTPKVLIGGGGVHGVGLVAN